MIRMGIIGLGYWGPNLARNFANLSDSQLTAICDRDDGRLKHISEQYPDTSVSRESDKVLTKEKIDAAVIATPTTTHYSLAKQSIEQGLHTFVEKPLATSPKECENLIRLAEEKGVILFVGHVFLYTAAVLKLEDLIRSGELGDICYISSTRLNLGPIRQDVNALWDLASHDISIILDLMESSPTSVNCQGLAHLNDSVHDICSLSLHFEDKRMAISHVSWLDPNKTRLMTIVGDKKMAIYNDIEPLEKIKIFDKGVQAPAYSDTFGEFQFSYHYGDVHIPMLDQVEPLKAECQNFLECIKTGNKPKTDGQNGLDVVRVLYAADSSLHNGGGRVGIGNSNGYIESNLSYDAL